MNASEDVEKGKPCLVHYWECTLVQPPWKTTEVPQKTKNLYAPAVPLLGVYIYISLQKERNQYIKKIPALPCLLQHYS